MNQTIRIIFVTILVALNFTHPAHADAQQKFSFQGVSYNGDIKPEQFSFSDVIIKASSYSKKSVKTPLLEVEMLENMPLHKCIYVQNASLRSIFVEPRISSATPISGFVV